MYKVIKYLSTHDLEVGINEMNEKGYALVNVASATPWTFAWVFVKKEPLPTITETEWTTDEPITEKTMNQSDDWEETES